MIPISQFFARLGLPLRNVRNSWGASDGEIVLLRAWSDRYDGRRREVTLLRPVGEYLDSQGGSRPERVSQLRQLWRGGVAGYVVLVEAKDPKEVPRTIAGYREDVVFPIEALRIDSNGTTIGVLSAPVALELLRDHASRLRLRPTPTPPPE